MKLGRNETCWCGSGRKYKSCHMAFDEKIEHYMLTYPHAEEPPRSIIKTPAQIEGIRKAGEINSMVLDSVAEMIGEGVSTQEIDDLVAKRTANLGGICACLGYQGYPKNVCTSIDDVVCHGIPDPKRILQSGDIINVDCTTIVDGFYGDASRMF